MRLSIVTLSFLVAQAAAFMPSAPTFRHKTSLFKTKAPVFDEVCTTTGVTLKRFMSEVAKLNPDITELTILFGGIETACKAITNLVKRSQLPTSETLGYQGEVNVQGEDQKVKKTSIFLAPLSLYLWKLTKLLSKCRNWMLLPTIF